MSFDYRLKIIIIGEPSVGKSSLIVRYTEVWERGESAFGFQISNKKLVLNSKTSENKIKIKLYIFDIADQSKFLKKEFLFKEAHGFILVYDITNEESFEKTAKWFNLLKESEPFEKDFTGILIGNKIDLQDQRKIPRKIGEKLAKEMNVDFEETSAKTRENVNDVFERITHMILNKVIV